MMVPAREDQGRGVAGTLVPKISTISWETCFIPTRKLTVGPRIRLSRLAAVGLDDPLAMASPALGDGRPPSPHRLEGHAGDLAWHPNLVVEHADRDPTPPGPLGHLGHPRDRRGQAGDRGVERQRDVAPVPLQAQDPRPDGGEAEGVRSS
jgi:hypothetical protein